MIDIQVFLENYLPPEIRKALQFFPPEKQAKIHEIRLRRRRVSTVTLSAENVVLRDKVTGKPVLLTDEEIQRTFLLVCENSIYKYENEIKQGYITLKNGCRVGFCGSRYENGMLKDISSMNIRISKSVFEASKEIFSSIYENGTIISTLIVSPPCGGKTTLLGDIARKLSDECKKRCAIVDERGEIAAAHRGVPQKEVGQLSDVLDGYPKGIGMMIALRSLSPQALICDEVGTEEDAAAMIQAMNAGIPVIASAHAENEIQLMSRPQIRSLMDSGAIEQVIFLEGAAHPGKFKKRVRARDLYENCGRDFNHSQRPVGHKKLY